MSFFNIFGIIVVVLCATEAILIFYDKKMARNKRFKLAMLFIFIAFLCLAVRIINNTIINTILSLIILTLGIIVARYFIRSYKNLKRKAKEMQIKNEKMKVKAKKGRLKLKTSIVQLIILLELCKSKQLHVDKKYISNIKNTINKMNAKEVADCRKTAQKILKNDNKRVQKVVQKYNPSKNKNSHKKQE